jgi:hypothetical protein
LNARVESGVQVGRGTCVFVGDGMGLELTFVSFAVGSTDELHAAIYAKENKVMNRTVF